MKKVGFSLVFVLVLTTFAGPGWADPSVNTVSAVPNQIPTGQKTTVKVTARISDPQLLMTANLYRVNANGTKTWLGFLNDLGLDGDFKAKDGVFTDAHVFNEPNATTINLQVVVFFVLPDKQIHRDESSIMQVQVGGILPPNTGGTITGDGGVKVTIANNTLPYRAFVNVGAVDASAIKAPVGTNLKVVGALKLTLEGVDDIPEPSVTAPLQLSFPRPAGPAASRYLIAQQIVFERPRVENGQIVIDRPNPLTPLLMPVAEAQAVGTNIVTQFNPTLKGLQKSGTYAVLEAPGSGFVSGTVREAGVAYGGVVVTNSSNTLVTLSNSSGNYGLFISGLGTFSLTAFHPLRGSADIDSVTIATDGQTVQKDLDLQPISLSTPLNVRPGVRNGGFERRDVNGNCDLNGWGFSGTANAVTQLGPTTPLPPGLPNNQGPGGLGTVPVTPVPNPVTIFPTEGQCMAMIDTGGPATGSALRQVFTVPAGASTLRVDYDYVSEELPEWIGSQFQDTFKVLITPAGSAQTEIASVTVDGANQLGFILIGDCNFPGGDNTCAHTGWRTASVNLAQYAGQTVTIELLFSVTDVGDNIFDTRVLVDNIRFSTLYLDIKAISGAGNGGLPTVADRIQKDVRHATEILSQAGVNVQLRNITTVSNNALLDITQAYPHSANPAVCTVVNGVDGVPLTNLHLEPEEVTLMNTQRSGTTTDVNVYYVVSSSVSGARGWTANPGDFCQEVNIGTNTNWGALITDIALTSTLAHELGHALVTAISNSALLHNCVSAEGTCFTISGAPDTAIVTTDQSVAVNGATIKQP
jgi:hypothetical protein